MAQNKDVLIKAATLRSSPKTKAPARKRASSSKPSDGSRRTWIVLTALTGGLACTGALLKALAPPPLTPDASTSLYAVDQGLSMDGILDTPVPIVRGRWRSIYVHHTMTASGNVQTLADAAEGPGDHFVIGNGNGLSEGAVQTAYRWSQQEAAGSMPGVTIPPDCITISLVGDFNQRAPTPTQQARLLELVAALQRQLGIESRDVILGVEGDRKTSAGIGSRFPAGAFRSQLSP